jgi:hypothetical protein
MDRRKTMKTIVLAAAAIAVVTAFSTIPKPAVAEWPTCTATAACIPPSSIRKPMNCQTCKLRRRR